MGILSSRSVLLVRQFISLSPAWDESDSKWGIQRKESQLWAKHTRAIQCTQTRYSVLLLLFFNLMTVLLTLLLRMRITRMMTMVVVFVTISYIHFTDITQDVLKQNVSANKQIVPSSENIWVSLQLWTCFKHFITIVQLLLHHATIDSFWLEYV